MKIQINKATRRTNRAWATFHHWSGESLSERSDRHHPCGPSRFQMGYDGTSWSLGADGMLQYQQPETETVRPHPAATMVTVWRQDKWFKNDESKANMTEKSPWETKICRCVSHLWRIHHVCSTVKHNTHFHIMYSMSSEFSFYTNCTCVTLHSVALYRQMTHLLCFPFERNSPFADPIIPVLSYLHSLLQWDVRISAMTVTV